MKETTYCRKIDPNGRLVIPIRLREQLNIQAGDEMVFYTHEHDGKTYLCIPCGESEIERAKRILREAGLSSQT